MADKNIQIKFNNGTDWDNLFPKTKASLVTLSDSRSVETAVTELVSSLTSKITLAQVTTEIQKVVGLAPAALDTLKEISDALGNDANFAATITNQLTTKVDKVAGKGLSTNDFTAALKTKLDGLTDLTAAVAAKAPQATTYTKTEVDTAVSAKAPQSTTYTKVEVDTRIENLQANAIPVSTTQPVGASVWFQEV